ncbi:MAG: DUF1700 domain-containing protein [Bdellovibrionales bacterium]|nr:DUF1700 domain-containing protein [Bdellovibrionales bacterium]
MQSQELELYLQKLDQSLGSISVSEKAEIITEIKSHVIEAIQNDPTQSVTSVLRSLGEPEQVANRYLLERGLRPQLAPKHPVLKWLVVGFLGTFAIMVFGVILLVSQFMPIIHVDEQKGRVQILGGLIDVNSDLGQLEIGGLTLDNFDDENDVRVFSGTKSLKEGNWNSLEMKFSNGKARFEISKDEALHYNCKVSKNREGSIFNETDPERLVLDLSKMAYSKCTISLPRGISTIVDGKNGKINIERPNGPFKIQLLNGKIDIEPNESLAYSYNLKVVNGKIDDFENDASEAAIAIEASVINGAIKRN